MRRLRVTGDLGEKTTGNRDLGETTTSKGASHKFAFCF